MTIENLKQIAIKYATTKGSRVPLAPDELCNAVVQYFNEFLKITADINTIQVAVTEEGGNIVFTITGNTLDGKAFTPIVITVDHNDFVTDQEFEAFKTTINAAIQKNTESINSLSFRVEDTENDITTIQVQVGQINTRVGNTETNVTNLKNRVDNTETNIVKINSTLNNKLDKITSPMSNFVLYANIEGNDRQISATASPVPNTVICRDNIGKATIVKGVSGQDVANMENIADVEAKIPDVSGFATTEQLQEVENKIPDTSNLAADINTIQVAVTEEGGNIVFTITGNTLDGKAFTPIVITVDHNDFVTDQEFEAFKTTINAAIQKNTESINSLSFRVEDTENDITTIQVQVGQINTRVGNTETNVTNLKNRVDNTETNIVKINSTLNNKLDKITSPMSNFVLYANIEGNDRQISATASPVPNTVICRDNIGKATIVKGVSGQDVANMENIADVEAKIPDVSGFATTEQLQEVENKIPDTSNLATKTELQEVESKIPDTTNFADVTKANTFAEINTFNKRVYFKEIHFEDNDYNIYNTYANNQGIYSKYVADVSENMYNIKELGLYYYCLGTVTNDGMFHEFLFPNEGGTLALTSDIPAIPEYTSVDSVIYDTTNGAIIAYNGANEIHIPLLAGENVTIDASEDNTKIVISAAGGGGTGDVTAAGNNTFTGVNTFNNSIYAKNGVVAEGTTNYGANSVRKGPNTYSFPNKSGTFAMTTDVIKNPIYFISFYANDPSEPCHLIGTIMSKNSYGTGQKTNEEFAVMLADNLYTNSNEGLAAYGRLANKDILCIYSEDGLSIRCLDEENSEVDLPTVMFFVMETEL